MSVLRVMFKYAGYYVLMTALISLFAGPTAKGLLLQLCGAALSVSMFASIIQLLTDGKVGITAEKVSAWCLRGTAIVSAIVVITGIGFGNIIRLFTGN